MEVSCPDGKHVFVIAAALLSITPILKPVRGLIHGDQRKSSGAPAINGRAYPIEDHNYDVVVGAGGAPACAPSWDAAKQVSHCLHHQSISDTLTHSSPRRCMLRRLAHGRG
jgi:hypothetical protein